MSRPVVFLDLDDVLCLNDPYTGFDARDAVRPSGGMHMKFRPTPPDMWDRLFARQPKANLRALHDEFAPWYVVSSSWRKDFTRREMEIVFQQSGLEFVAAALHETWRTVEFGHSPIARVQEIAEWIARRHDDGAPWVAIDDWQSGESLIGHDRAVLCDVGVGFDGDKLQQARDVLRE